MMISMLYAEVIVKQRTRVEELSYAVPASMVPYIRSGSLVSVPLRRRTVAGIVVGLRRNVEANLRAKIRPITKIDRTSRLSEAEIAVMRRLADHYGASLAEVAFHALERPVLSLTTSDRVKNLPPVMLRGSVDQRFRAYVSLMAKQKQLSFLCLFAQKTFATYFVEVARRSGVEVLLDDGKAGFLKRLKALSSEGKRFVVATTIGGAFLPLKTGDCLIVDQPDHVGAKQRQRPYMSSKTIALNRAKAEGIRLIFGDELIAVVDFEKWRRREWSVKSLPRPHVPTTIISRLGSSNLIQPSIIQAITQALSGDGQVLVMVLARGWASALLCRDCGHILRCPICHQTLAVDEGQLSCRYDATQITLPTTCPACCSQQLVEAGEGVSRVRAEMARNFPSISVGELSSDQPVTGNQTITVATEKALSFPDQRYQLVVALSVDRLVAGTALNDRSQLVRLIRQLRGQTKQIMIQTFFPEDPIWKAANGSAKEFLVEEIVARKRLKLPPFGILFDLIGSASKREEMEERSEVVTRIVTRSLPNVQISSPSFTPSAGRGWQVAIRCYAPTFPTQARRQIASELPPSFHLDVEPFD